MSRGEVRVLATAWTLALAAAGCRPAATDPFAADGPYRVASTIEVGAAPHGIRFSDDGDTAYVALSGDGQVAVVDLVAGVVVERWEAGVTPLDLIRVDDGWLVSQFQDSTILLLDPDGRIVPERTRLVGDGPSLFTPDVVRGQAWIVTEFSNRLFTVDVAAGVPVSFHTTGDRPYPADVMWDGSHAFVPNLEDGTVSVVDLLNRETDATVAVCPGPPGGALTRDQVSYLVACGGSNEVAWVNTASFEVTDRMTEGIGPRPFSIVTSSDGRHAIVNNAGGSTVSVVDLQARSVVQRLQVGAQPIVLRAHPDGSRIYVANEVSGTLVELRPIDPSSGPGSANETSPVNEVVVLGMIHGQHETSERFGLDVVRQLVEAIDPDYWLVEIPPNRWDRARAEFEATGIVVEPRVRRFPEYIDVLFPLSRELDFEVIPTAGWTQPMSDFRSARLAAFEADPSRATDWAEYEAANAASAAAIAAGGEPDDPRWIHTDDYDGAYEIRLSTYNRLFNEELGPGGWDHINESHYALISAALDAHRGEGARVLITYGAGHKGWFLRELRKRDDIELLDATLFLDSIGR